MKQILRNVFIAAVLVLAMTSCYDDYKEDHIFSSTYFSMQYPLRTVLVEGSDAVPIEFGAMLSGRYENTVDEIVDFIIDPTLISDDTSIVDMHLLPESYYTLSDESQITIESGSKLGTVTINFTEAFINDVKSYGVYYALPLRITGTSLDSITEGMETSIIAVKCQNDYYGAYRVKGVDYTLDATGNSTDTIIYSLDDFQQNAYTISGSLAKDTVTLPYVGSEVSGDNSMKLAIAADASVIISEDVVQAGNSISGTGRYDADEKAFYLEYTYDKAGEVHEISDTIYHFDTPLEVETWF